MELEIKNDLPCETEITEDSTIRTYADHEMSGAHLAGNTEEDHFIHRDGKVFAGSHIIIDLYDAQDLTDKELMENVFRQAIEECGATLLHIHLHVFEPSGGLSGVAVLAESHISVHTWPERGYAAFDVFMCGDAMPLKAVPILEKAFKAGHVEVTNLDRGDQISNYDNNQ